MAGRRARSEGGGLRSGERRGGGAAGARGGGPFGPRAEPPARPRRSQPGSSPDLPAALPEAWPPPSPARRLSSPRAPPARRRVVLKKIVARAVEVPAARAPRRSPRIAFFLEKENKPPYEDLTPEDLFKPCAVPVTPASSPVLSAPKAEPGPQAPPGPAQDARDLEMSRKVRRSYSRLEAHAATSTPGRRSCFGFERLLADNDLAGVSPVVGCKIEPPRPPSKPSFPDPALPGISPMVAKEKRKKKKPPEILKSELDEWAAAMNAEFEAAEQFALVVE